METAERVTTKWVEISPERRKDLESLGYDRNSWDNKVMPSSPSKTKLQGLSTSKHHDFEFGGPINVIFMMVGLPVGVWGLYLACNERSEGCPRLEVPDFSKYSFYSHEAMAVVLLWMTWLVVLWVVIPGEWVEGAKLPDGSKLKYKMNGFSSMLVTYGALAAAQYTGVIRLSWLYNQQLQVATAAIIFSAVLSVYLYVSARMNKDCMKAEPGNTGVVHYDFFMGHELNPRIGSFDLKVFFELRPGLVGWTVLNTAMAMQEYETRGEVSVAMWIVNIFQAVYVMDALFYEAAILTTMDVTTDGFGFMLVFGDIAWVPFTYGLQARYLANSHYAVVLSPLYTAGILMVAALGYYVFRSSNGQKNKFRQNPDDPAVKHLKTLPTERGTKLIIDGWWGTSRHINYFGDWIMAWAWCLPCGLTHPIPYFYVAYFAGLLIHRERRDDHGCRVKYGKDWDKYCSIVQYRIVPYVY